MMSTFKNDSVQVEKELRTIILILNKKIAEQAEKNLIENYLLLALNGLTKYTGVLLNRLIEYQNTPIEYTALTARNLFECYLLITYINGDESRAKEYISQKPIEEIELNESFLLLTTENTSPVTIKQLRDRIDYITNLKNTFDLKAKKHWNVSELAKQTGNILEYKAFFKIHSKFTHPSSLIVNSMEGDFNNEVFLSVFSLQGLLYTQYIVKIISEYIHKEKIN